MGASLRVLVTNLYELWVQVIECVLLTWLELRVQGVDECLLLTCISYGYELLLSACY